MANDKLQHLTVGDTTYDIANNIITMNNLTVSSWTEDTTYEDYGYKADIPVTDCTENHIPYVTLSPTDANSGNYCPVALSSEGTVTIYSKVDDALTILTLQCIKAV